MVFNAVRCNFCGCKNPIFSEIQSEIPRLIYVCLSNAEFSRFHRLCTGGSCLWCFIDCPSFHRIDSRPNNFHSQVFFGLNLINGVPGVKPTVCLWFVENLILNWKCVFKICVTHILSAVSLDLHKCLLHFKLVNSKIAPATAVYCHNKYLNKMCNMFA